MQGGWSPAVSSPEGYRTPAVRARGEFVSGRRPVTLNISGARFVFGADAKPQMLEWLWPDVLLAGEFSLLAGEGGVGKSSIAASIAAMVTRGGSWPTAECLKAGGVAYFEGEDNLNKVTIPRLMAAGADMSRLVLSGEVFDLSQDLFELQDVVRRLEARSQTKVRLLVLSPVRMFFGTKESFNNVEVRNRLTLVQAWAERTGVTVLGIHHPSNGNAFGGSRAWKEAALAGLFAEKTDSGQRRMKPLKSNGGPDNWEMPYTTEAAQPDGFPTSRIVWGAKVIADQNSNAVEDGDEDLQDEQSDTTQISEAVSWLSNVVPEGSEVDYSEIKQAALKAGISKSTLYRAAERLRIKKLGGGFGKTSRWSR